VATEAEHVRAEIERAREQVASSVEALRGEIVSTVSWREWVRRNPYAAVVGAFLLGFLYGNRK
jgi:hypothetical protein